jgi:hypothetical protein
MRWLGSKTLDGTYQVAGVDGSSKAAKPSVCNIPRATSWIDYWMLMTGKDAPRRCCVKGCSNDVEVGLHVWIKSQKNHDRCFILPGCKAHNSKTYDYDAADTIWMTTNANAILAPAPTTNSMFND